jgi:aryl-alcohol dehydrogenase-like predicted oxidoreductase
MENEYLKLFADYKMGTTIWSPLASGILTGKYNDEIPTDSRLAMPKYNWLFKRYDKSQFDKTRELAVLAKKMDIPLAQLSLAWCLKNPNVSTVITGATKPGQVKENMGAIEVLEKLSPSVMDEIERILQNKPRKVDDWRSM